MIHEESLSCEGFGCQIAASAYECTLTIGKVLEAAHTVPTPAHTSTAAVASFRTWRDSQYRVARGPAQATIERGRMVSITKPF